MTVLFSTNEFEFSHGRAPRGFGSWAFFFDGATDVATAFWVHQSLFGAAKKAALVEARRRRASRVEVGS